MQRWERLVDLNLTLIRLICSWLGLECTTVRSSELNIQGERNERLLNLCYRFGARRYLSGDAAKAYLDVERFRQQGIDVQWQCYQHPIYPQLHGEFMPYLSILDLILNCGDESAAVLERGADVG